VRLWVQAQAQAQVQAQAQAQAQVQAQVQAQAQVQVQEYVCPKVVIAWSQRLVTGRATSCSRSIRRVRISRTTTTAMRVSM
jgi:hypothetical protein